MESIPRLNARMKQVFEQEAVDLAREAGLRQRSIPLSKLALLLVLGWWHLPRSGLSLYPAHGSVVTGPVTASGARGGGHQSCHDLVDAAI